MCFRGNAAKNTPGRAGHFKPYSAFFVRGCAFFGALLKGIRTAYGWLSAASDLHFVHG
jgi:hypothetical protein